MTSEGTESSAMTLSDYMTLARELQARCRQMTKVKGAQKLERIIGTEIKFFLTVSFFCFFCSRALSIWAIAVRKKKQTKKQKQKRITIQ